MNSQKQSHCSIHFFLFPRRQKQQENRKIDCDSTVGNFRGRKIEIPLRFERETIGLNIFHFQFIFRI